MTITASEARRALLSLIEQVNDDRAPIEITSKRGNAMLMSADDYAAWQETAYLFRSPTNVATAAEHGETVEHQSTAPASQAGERLRRFDSRRLH